MNNLSEIDIESFAIPHLNSQFSSASPILFTGAGFSLGAKSQAGKNIPTATKLTKLLWNIAYPDHEFESESELQDVFQAAASSAGNKTKRLLEDLFIVDPRSIQEYHLRLLDLPWSAIYTLNIDDLIEKALSKQGVKVDSISALRPSSDLFAPTHKTRIIHLNGVLNDAPERITFSRLQYASRTNDSLYAMLVRDLRFRPVVFIGTSLEEKLFWHYITLRGDPPQKRNEKELRPKSYLVIPDLSLAKASILARYNIHWFKGTSEQFLARVIAKIDDGISSGKSQQRSQSSQAKAPNQLEYLAKLSVASPAPSEYLFGAEPCWDDAMSGRIAIRPSSASLDDLIRQTLSTRTAPNLVFVSGTAGTGKSSMMMMAALHWQAQGHTSVWVSREAAFNLSAIEDLIRKDETIRLVFFEDADLLRGALPSMTDRMLSDKPAVCIVAECRSSKIDSVQGSRSLPEIGAVEFTVPHLVDDDIAVLLEVLEKENRLGQLQGMDRDSQTDVFRKECGRQLLVAMYKATQGRDFQDKAIEEFKDLSPGKQLLYGIVSVAHANRLYVHRAEIAFAFGDDHYDWPQDLDLLVRRKLLLLKSGQLRARHREIAQFLYDHLMECGFLADTFKALIKISGSQSFPGMRRNERPARMLSRFINHNLLKRKLGYASARAIYEDFENLLSGNHHYWLHRGALELESSNFHHARTFLSQAKGIDPTDIFVDVELAYLDMKVAIDRESRGIDSSTELDEAIASFEFIAEHRPDQRSHVTHIGANQTLAWLEVAPEDREDAKRRIAYWIKGINRISSWQDNPLLKDIEHQLRRKLLSLAVKGATSGTG